MTWSDFKAEVLANLTTDGTRLGVETFRDNLIQAAARDVQTFVKRYQRGNTKIMYPADFITEGEASRGTLEAGACVREMWYYRCTQGTVVSPSDPEAAADVVIFPVKFDWPWSRRHELITAQVNLSDQNAVATISPEVTEFIIYPKVDLASTVAGYDDVTLAFTSSDVDVSANTIVLPGNLSTGEVLRLLGAHPPGGLAEGLLYYAIRISYNGGTDKTTCCVADTLFHAVAGLATELTSTGSGGMSFTTQTQTCDHFVKYIWDGVASEWEDNDETPFDAEVALACMWYVKGLMSMSRSEREGANFLKIYQRERLQLYLKQTE